MKSHETGRFNALHEAAEKLEELGHKEAAVVVLNLLDKEGFDLQPIDVHVENGFDGDLNFWKRIAHSTEVRVWKDGVLQFSMKAALEEGNA